MIIKIKNKITANLIKIVPCEFPIFFLSRSRCGYAYTKILRFFASLKIAFDCKYLRNFRKNPKKNLEIYKKFHL
jgi:hypothetical protein